MGVMKYICPKCSNRYDNPYCTKCNINISKDDWIIEDKEVEKEISNTDIDNLPDKTESSKNNSAIYIIAAIICIIGFIGIIEIFNSPSSKDYKKEAYVLAQHVVEQQLKAPKTAKFPWYNDSYIKVSSDKYTVSAYVDAENSFGANVRTYFTVTMTRNGDDWENINVAFN